RLFDARAVRADLPGAWETDSRMVCAAVDAHHVGQRWRCDRARAWHEVCLRLRHPREAGRVGLVQLGKDLPRIGLSPGHDAPGGLTGAGRLVSKGAGVTAGLLALLALVFLAANGLTRLLCSPASRLYHLDHPNERSLHAEPLPRTGGLAIFGSILLGIIVTVALGEGAIFQANEILWILSMVLLV